MKRKETAKITPTSLPPSIFLFVCRQPFRNGMVNAVGSTAVLIVKIPDLSTKRYAHKEQQEGKIGFRGETKYLYLLFFVRVHSHFIILFSGMTSTATMASLPWTRRPPPWQQTTQPTSSSTPHRPQPSARDSFGSSATASSRAGRSASSCSPRTTSSASGGAPPG